MAWTTPRTWADGEVVTAALLNAQIRDNLDEVSPEALTATYAGRGEIALSIHDYDPTPASIAAVLDSALADGAATSRTVLLGQGTWTSAKAGQHLIKSFTGLVGDPSGGTILQLTHADGGLTVQDTAGSGGIYAYESRLRDLWINGMGVCKKPVTAIQSEEMEFRNVRIQGWTEAGMVLDSVSLALLDRVAFAGDDTTLAKPGVRLLNDTGSLEIRSPNFYKCLAVELAGTGVSDMRFTGLPWFEEVAELISINSPGNSVSATIRTTGHAVSSSTDMRLLRLNAAGAVYGSFSFDDMTISAAALTSALFDTSALANTGVMAIAFRRAGLTLAAAAPVLLAPNAAQAWNTLIWEPVDLYKDNTGQIYYDTTKWFPPGFVTGSAFTKPFSLQGSGTPENVYAAPVGSTYQRIDIGNVSMYRKVLGTGKIGWQPLGVYAPVKTVTANYTATYEDSVIIGNAAGITITLPTAGSYGGRRYTIKNINAASLTVGGTVDGVVNPTLATDERMTVVTDGTAWRRID